MFYMYLEFTKLLLMEFPCYKHCFMQMFAWQGLSNVLPPFPNILIYSEENIFCHIQPKISIRKHLLVKSFSCCQPLIWMVFTFNFFWENVFHLYYVGWTVLMLNWTKELLPNPRWMKKWHVLFNECCTLWTQLI